MKFYRNLAFMLKFIWKYNKVWLLLAIINMLINAIMPLTNLIFPKYIVDATFEQRDLKMAITWVSIFVLINLSVQYVLSILSYLMAKQKNKLFCSFNVYIAELIMDMDFKELENPETLNMKERAMGNAFSGGQGFCGSVEVFFSIITQIIVFIGASIKITEINPLLILLIVLVVCANTWFNSKINRDNYKLDQAKVPIERKNSYIFQLMSDFSFGKEIRLYGLKDYIIKKYVKIASESNEFYEKSFHNNHKNRSFSAFTGSIQLIVVYFVLIIQASNISTFTYGDFTVQFNTINTLYSTILSIVSDILNINQIGFYIEDLEKFVSLPRTIDQKGADLEESFVYNFKFRNVYFRYPGDNKYVLKNINMEFSSKEKISLVGLNGAGKTTFIKLLLRLYDVESGEILLNGKNIKNYNYATYRRLFATVFQDYKLFAYSVKENITLTENEYDKNRFSHAVQESGVSCFVNKKSNGINSYIYKIFDESGFEPSGGEGQKIAIARALYKDAKFIVLDEPTSALDPIAEYDLYSRINCLTNSKGCLFVSHRLSTTIWADRIFVFDGGEIVESGSHKELIKNENGLYKEMFDKQSSYYKG